MPIKVTARPGEPGERFVQRFKRICSRSGLFREMRERRAYEKPSQRRRRKAKESARQIRRALRRAERRKKAGAHEG
jgi:small subunit ribosomal protein S21